MWQNKKLAPRSILFAVLAIVLMVTAACGKDGAKSGPDGIVAEYDGGKVETEEFEQYKNMMRFTQGPLYAQMEMFPDFERNLLNQYIAIKLSAERADASQSERARQKAVEDWNETKQLYAEQEQEEMLLNQLEEHDLTEEELLDFVTMQTKAMYVYQDQVTDEDVTEMYEEMVKNNELVLATVRHILIGTKDPFSGETIREDEEALKLAREVREKLLAGESFDELAAEYSDDPGSSDNGGRYENVNVNSWTPAFRDAALELEIGEISEPIETPFGYHVMQVEERSVQSLEDVRESLEMRMASEKLWQFMQEEVPDLITAVYLPEPEQEE